MARQKMDVQHLVEERHKLEDDQVGCTYCTRYTTVYRVRRARVFLYHMTERRRFVRFLRRQTAGRRISNRHAYSCRRVK